MFQLKGKIYLRLNLHCLIYGGLFCRGRTPSQKLQHSVKLLSCAPILHNSMFWLNELAKAWCKIRFSSVGLYVISNYIKYLVPVPWDASCDTGNSHLLSQEAGRPAVASLLKSSGIPFGSTWGNLYKQAYLIWNLPGKLFTYIKHNDTTNVLILYNCRSCYWLIDMNYFHICLWSVK